MKNYIFITAALIALFFLLRNLKCNGKKETVVDVIKPAVESGQKLEEQAMIYEDSMKQKDQRIYDINTELSYYKKLHQSDLNKLEYLHNQNFELEKSYKASKEAGQYHQALANCDTCFINANNLRSKNAGLKKSYDAVLQNQKALEDENRGKENMMANQIKMFREQNLSFIAALNKAGKVSEKTKQRNQLWFYGVTVFDKTGMQNIGVLGTLNLKKNISFLGGVTASTSGQGLGGIAGVGIKISFRKK